MNTTSYRPTSMLKRLSRTLATLLVAVGLVLMLTAPGSARTRVYFGVGTGYPYYSSPYYAPYYYPTYDQYYYPSYYGGPYYGGGVYFGVGGHHRHWHGRW